MPSDAISTITGEKIPTSSEVFEAYRQGPLAKVVRYLWSNLMEKGPQSLDEIITPKRYFETPSIFAPPKKFPFGEIPDIRKLGAKWLRSPAAEALSKPTGVIERTARTKQKLDPELLGRILAEKSEKGELSTETRTLIDKATRKGAVRREEKPWEEMSKEEMQTALMQTGATPA